MKQETGARRLKIILICFGAVFVFLLVLLAVSLTPFLSSFFGSRADNAVPTPSASVDLTTPTPSPSPASSYNLQTCQPVEVHDAEAFQISTSDPGLKEDIDVIYYPIYGSTYEQLMEQIRTCGPENEGRRYAGLTNWHINWVYDYGPSFDGCDIDRIAVGVKIDIYYPDWQKPASFNKDLKYQWQQYMNSLISHENEHKRLDLEAANEVMSQLSSYPGTATCDDVQTTANYIGHQVLDQLKIDNANFDDRTNHGVNP